MNDNEIENLLDTRADVTIVSLKSWPPDCPLWEVDIHIQFLGVGTLKYIYIFKCIRPKRSNMKIKAICG